MNKRTILLTVLAFAFASTACQPPAQQMASGTLSDEDVARRSETPAKRSSRRISQATGPPW